MLHYFCAIALLITQAASSGNYFVGKFQGSFPWAYPLGKCSPSGLLVFPPVMYTCSADGETITETVYKSADTTCSGTIQKTLTYDASTVLPNGTYSYYCNGTNDYMATKLYVGACGSSTSATVYNAINACFQIGSGTNITALEMTQCSGVTATVSSYLDYVGTCDVPSALTSIKTLNTSCAFYLSNSGENVFAEVTDCVYNGNSQIPKEWNNNASVDTSQTVVKTVDIYVLLYPYSTAYADPELCSVPWFTLLNVFFNGSYIDVETECYSLEGELETYAGISIEIDVIAYSSIANCTTLLTQLEYVVLNYTGINIELSNFTCTEATVATTTVETTTVATTAKTTAPAPMKAVSLCVFVISLLAAFLM